MPPTVAISDLPAVGEVFRRSALPAVAAAVNDLGSGRGVALHIVTAHRTEPLDAATMMRSLHLLRSNEIRPGAPVIFDTALPTLSRLLDARTAGEQPLIVTVEAGGLLDRPAEALRAVESARRRGWEVGLRGVGATYETLAAVQLVQPSLVWLSASVLEHPTSTLAMETLATTAAFEHSTGATIAAHDLDTPTRLATAVGLGATIGSGRAVPERRTQVPTELDLTLDLFAGPVYPDHRHSPFQIAALRHDPRTASKAMLVALSRELERSAASAGRSTMVLASFQHAHEVVAETRRRYEQIGRDAELVLLTARGLTGPAVPGTTFADLGRRDSLVDEWLVLVLSPTSAALLTAHDLKKRARSEADRQFLYVLTYDRDLVAHAARSMLTRVEQR